MLKKEVVSMIGYISWTLMRPLMVVFDKAKLEDLKFYKWASLLNSCYNSVVVMLHVSAGGKLNQAMRKAN